MTDDQIDQFEHLLLIYIQEGHRITRRNAIRDILRHLRQTRTIRKRLEKGMKI